ncbi:MAG TPA: DUF433 domain-containing protein [Thermoanaerobaculia bacterium]|nr:DUF433 domain-containing protein [Thermoanaerobaculia bacterium]
MADYKVLIKPSAVKEYDRLPANVASRVTKKIDSLASEPRPRGVKMLEGGPVRWRVSEQEILSEFPDLEPEDIRACLTFAADRERNLTKIT